MLVFRPKQTRMPEAEKKKKSSSRTAWERLDNRLAQGHDLIQKKRENLHKLETEKEASTNDEERKYLTTSIKAAQLDLEQDVRGLRRIRQLSSKSSRTGPTLRQPKRMRRRPTQEEKLPREGPSPAKKSTRC